MKQLTLLAIILIFQTGLLAQGDLTIEITGLKTLKGELYVSLYNKADHFMNPDKAFGKVKVPASQELVRVKLEDVPAGYYAVAVYQDLNANAVMDVTEMKVPKEPFGFSNNPRGTKGPATFDQAKFHFTDDMTIQTELVNNLFTPNKDKSENSK